MKIQASNGQNGRKKYWVIFYFYCVGEFLYMCTREDIARTIHDQFVFCDIHTHCEPNFSVVE